MTVICGLGTLAFAEFGKFREAGIAITLALTLVWLAALTFSPPLLRLAGRWTFWPRTLTSMAAPRNEISAVTLDPCGQTYPSKFRAGWQWAIGMIACRPAFVLGITIALLLPFAGLGIVWNNWVSYNLVGNLPASSPSVAGTRALERHFPPGMIGQVNVLVIDRGQDFRKSTGRELVRALTERLKANLGELGLYDVRTLTAPLGLSAATRNLPPSITPESIEAAALDTFVSSLGQRGSPATRVDLLFQRGPFDDAAIAALGRVESMLKESLAADSEIYSLGTTATIRDLQGVMQRDRGHVERTVLVTVFIVLIVLLRQLVIPVFLLVSVLLSYVATLGVTFVVFWALNPADFAGLDWKVTVFLFAILIAVGEDYNIFLVTRVAEEQARIGPIRGVTEALVRTGPIISSCGVIMAGTFASLMAGTLNEMRQLGFALAFGVLLDTFVVRPVMVPAFLILYFGRKQSGVILPQEKLSPVVT
jgi:RND superfamily putative drug exporter